MVRDHADGYVIVIIFSIFFSGKLAYMVAESFERIHVKNRIHVLDHRCQTFQTHSCINVFLLELAVVAISVIVELGEHVIPDLHITVAGRILQCSPACRIRTFPRGHSIPQSTDRTDRSHAPRNYLLFRI